MVGSDRVVTTNTAAVPMLDTVVVDDLGVFGGWTRAPGQASDVTGTWLGATQQCEANGGFYGATVQLTLAPDQTSREFLMFVCQCFCQGIDQQGTWQTTSLGIVDSNAGSLVWLGARLGNGFRRISR
jgi:hypothetical protein